MGVKPSYIGVKDFFTFINVLGGVGAIVCAVFGKPEWGVISIFLGYMFGDSLDGYVARKTGTANRFGAEFDSATDQLSEGIAPAVVVAAYFANLDMLAWACVVSCTLCLVAILRVARFATAKFPSGSAYCGLPRVAVGVIAAGLPYSQLAVRFLDPWMVGVAILGFSSLSLIPIPYGSHKGRAIPRWAVAGLILFFAGSALLIASQQSFVADFLTIGFIGYAILGWFPRSS